MSPAEEALAAKDPTYADMCDHVVRARRKFLNAEATVDDLRTQLTKAESYRWSAQAALEAARAALLNFVERDCEDEA